MNNPRNQLHLEQSPYLLQHAENPLIGFHGRHLRLLWQKSWIVLFFSRLVILPVIGVM